MSTGASSHPTDRLSWLWLLVGAVLVSFTQFQTMIPLAAWLAPIFLLRFVRTQRARVALPILTLTLYLTTTFALRGIFPAPVVFVYGLMGIVSGLGYIADRSLTGRLGGLARTLVFPAATGIVDWGFGKSPLGTSGSVVYSQFGNLALTQIVSLGGIWGLAFLIAWLAPVVNEIWENGLQRRVLGYSLAPYAVVFAAVLSCGSVRVAFFSPQSGTAVRVASLAADRALSDHLHLPGLVEVAAGSDVLRSQAAAQYAPIVDDLFARTAAQARAGAKIVVWSEGAALALKEDEPQLLSRAQVAARQENIYLQLGVVFMLRTDRFPYEENRAVLIDPSGRVVWDYAKTVPALGEASLIRPGAGLIPLVDTPYGRLGTIICFDADLPTLVQQAGLARVDILLVPSNDWKPVAAMHSRAATFRAVENGLSLVRATGNGTTLVVDALGQVLAEADYFATDKLTVTAEVPTRGTATLYPRLGDSPVYLCLAILVLLAAVAALRRPMAAPAPTLAGRPVVDLPGR